MHFFVTSVASIHVLKESGIIEFLVLNIIHSNRAANW